MHRPSNSPTSIDILAIAPRWAPKIILLSLVVILVSTLYPFKFVLSESPSFLVSKTTKLDVVANVVLFMPLGFGLASALAMRKFNSLTKLLAIVVVGGSLSLTIEILQAFLPGRDSSLWDVLTNTLGAGIGYWLFESIGKLFYQWVPAGFAWLQVRLNRVSLTQLWIGIAAYIVLAAVLVLSWQKLSLHKWAIDQPLSVGSEVTVQMPGFLVPEGEELQTAAWKGTVSNLLISDRALNHGQIEQWLANPNAVPRDRSPVLALYPLKGKQALQDSTGQSPEFVWQGVKPAIATQAGVKLTTDRWLATATPVTLINQRIKNSAQFTLSATIAAAELATPGFIHPPILAISPLSTDPIYFGRLWRTSNLVLSQVGAELIVQMKISRTGRDQQVYTARIPAVFLDTKPHQIDISYSGFAVQVDIDGTARSFSIDVTPNRYQIVFYGLILMPLALLLSLIANRVQQRWVYLALIAGGVILPSLGLESLFVSAASRPMRATNLLLGCLIMGGTILAFKGKSRLSAQPEQIAANDSFFR